MSLSRRDFLKLTALLALPCPALAVPKTVRDFGAVGDGHYLDSSAINRAIEAAAAAGGGTVLVPAGNYLCGSIRLRSNVALYLDQGAVLIAAETGHDEPEPVQPWEAYQDYGHNHWHNSLIWGEDLHDISILGPGRIWGRGLLRDEGPGGVAPRGSGNKAIALKNCRNVLLQDFQILQGGWFGILATAVDNLKIRGLTIDTSRDGMDIDCCQDVHISDCSLNTPWDDAIVLKSSFALGHNRDTKNVTITGCYVTAAFKDGTLLDGTRQSWKPADQVWRTGRIKLGTESNGGYKNIAITNCIFEACQGLALESEDGALLEDVVVSNLTMRDVSTAPVFLRLGSRMRGPQGVPVGAIRRVSISGVNCSHSSSRVGCVISGIPGHPIEDLSLSDIYLGHQGGGTAAQAARRPPELETAYPDPMMFGDMPSQGFFIRHATRVQLSNIRIVAEQPDLRPGFVFQDVQTIDCDRLHTDARPVLVLDQVTDCTVRGTPGWPDAIKKTGDGSFTRQPVRR